MKLLVATLSCAMALAGIWGCGAEAATPDKLYGIWSGKSNESSHVTYTFILGGKCDVEFPKDKPRKPIEKAKWAIVDGAVSVERASGSKENLRLSGFDLACPETGLALHKLGMEY